ncbi:MAG: phosphate signaling complex protein PhoU [Bacteroidales bacterium]|jgi:phosphate transport system protein|nr:phosphate signaling complex protein PhoU [Bacteroidales bacterium]
MNHLENEINKLKEEISGMWTMVISQLSNAREALMNFDKDLAAEVLFKERMVDVYELKIDKDSESILALYQPVASDLRFVLAVLKINTNIERIADVAKGIAKFVAKSPKETLNQELLTAGRIEELFAMLQSMLSEVFSAFEEENPKLAFKVFAKDELIDKITRSLDDTLADYIRKNPSEIHETMQIFSIVRKLERVGDHCSNIAEEIVFCTEANVLKHSKKKKLKNS